MTAPTAQDGEVPTKRRMGNAIWIDWGRHLRTLSLTERLGIALFRITGSGNRIHRYLQSSYETLVAIRENRPRVVFSTNPSIVLSYLLLALRIRYRFVLVTDAHFVGVETFTSSRLMQGLLNYFNRRADLVIVTNPGHAKLLERIGARPFVCPDPLPRLRHETSVNLNLPQRSVFLICSFDDDEPYDEVFEAFSELSEHGFTLYVSGNYERAGVDPHQQPGITFLGFVDETTYYSYLRNVDVVMDLTDMENCLVCGAYEALVLEKPLILSGSHASRQYFGGACRFTDNTAPAIAQAVLGAWEDRFSLGDAARRWAEQNQLEIELVIDRLVSEVKHLAS